MPVPPWLDEWTEELCRLAATGITASDIAVAMNARFNLTLTRNAILGKAHRIHLRIGSGAASAFPMKPPPSLPRPAHQEKSGPKPKPKPERAPKPAPAPKPQRHITPPLEDAIPMGDPFVPIADAPPRRLFDLTRTQCRCAVDGLRGPSQWFCGRPVAPGKSYCPEHQARMTAGPGARISIPTVAKPKATDRIILEDWTS